MASRTRASHARPASGDAGTSSTPAWRATARDRSRAKRPTRAAIFVQFLRSGTILCKAARIMFLALAPGCASHPVPLVP